MNITEEYNRICANPALPYGVVYHTDGGGECAWEEGVIEYAEQPFVGDGVVIRVAFVFTPPNVVEIPAGDVGAIEYSSPPEELQEIRESE